MNVLNLFHMDEQDFRANGLIGRFVDPDSMRKVFATMKRDGPRDGLEVEVIRTDGARIWVQVLARMGIHKGTRRQRCCAAPSAATYAAS